jgi:hypothetical protein
LASQVRDALARRAVTLSPHSKANQAEIGKDANSGGQQAYRQRRKRARKLAPLPGPR